MIHFYGAPMSSAGRSHWMLEELEIPYEYHRVDLRDPSTKTEGFLAASPGGKIPAIDDSGTRVFESVAVNFYLAEKYRPEWLGKTAEDRAPVYQWSLWAITNLQPEILTFMRHSALLPEPDRIPKVADLAKAETLKLLAYLDRSLGSQEFVANGRFTVADVNVGSVVNIAYAMKMMGSEFPNATAYIERLRARPAFQRAMKPR